MQSPQPADLRQKAARFRDLARAEHGLGAKAVFTHYADRFAQQAHEREQAEREQATSDKASGKHRAA